MSPPTRPTMVVGAPCRLAATAWLPPLPPQTSETASPMRVSSEAGRRGRGDDDVQMQGADDDDSAIHPPVP